MAIDSIRNTFLNSKDLVSIGFFGAFMNYGWISLFIISPAFVVMMTLFGVTMLGLSILQIKNFFASNTNIEGVLKVLLSGSNLILLGIITATMAIFSIVALTLAIDLGAVVFAGFALINAPYLLLLSSSLILLTNGILMGLNVIRWLESPSNSPQRSHYLQASLSTLFEAVTSAVILSTVTVFLFFPFVPIALPALAAAAIFLTAANASWRLLSSDTKDLVKSIFGINKPLIENSVRFVLEQPSASSQSQLVIKDRGFRLFTAPDHVSTIKSILAKEWQKEYLLKIIDQKLTTYTNTSLSEKNSSKSKLLTLMRNQLTQDKELKSINKKEAANANPNVFDSFLLEKGEIESITDAFNWFCTNDQPANTCSLVVR